MDPATAKMAAQLAANLLRNRGVRYVLVGLLLLTLGINLSVVFGPWMLATQMAASLRAQQQATTDGGSCADSAWASDSAAPSAGSLSSEQIGNARVIYAVAIQTRAGDRGGVVGIATALQESSLRNLSYGDRDSVGLFQQRAGWGSTEQRMNPTKSAQLFYAVLLKVPGWPAMPVTRAAQAVQRSAFPDAYAKHERTASGLVALFRSKAPASSTDAVAAIGSAMCGAAGAAECPATGMAVEAGLTPELSAFFAV